MDPRHETLAWSPSQRRVLLVFLGALAGYVAVQAIRFRSTIADPQPPRAARAAELRDRIDPNTADIATLAALPGLGEKRAADLIKARDEMARQSQGRPVFSRPEDLLKIKGIGYAMMMQLEPYLIFPSPTTQPATSTGA